MTKILLHFTPFTPKSEILIGHSLPLNFLPKAAHYALLIEEKVKELWGAPLLKQLQEAGYNVTLFTLPSAEAAKTAFCKECIEEQMFLSHFGKECCVIGCGGGAVMDVAGFIASTYCRGVRLVFIPTTLLAMVDASIGGKTAINTAYGKNLIGTFYPAEKIIIDTAFLTTLDASEMNNGMAEIIKYGLIASRSLFDKLHSPFSLLEIIEESCRIKCAIAEQDNSIERPIRRILNFGHTFAHALENIKNYQISHGQAVHLGLLFESFLSYVQGFITQEELDQIVSLIQPYLTYEGLIDEKQLLAAMAFDKKAEERTPRFVLLKGIGAVQECSGEYCTKVKKEEIHEAFQWLHATTASIKAL